ncbi:hypothetical protein GCM10008164_00690 [Achromobacter xylosoxidans]|nr:hypothetical protein GCM10008164_00690 [Achromobacter xylosoxidans]
MPNGFDGQVDDFLVSRLRHPGYRGACQGAPQYVDGLARTAIIAIAAGYEIVHPAQRVHDLGRGYRGAQLGQRLVGFVHEQGDAVLTAVQPDPLVKPGNHAFLAVVAVLLDHCVDIFVAQQVDAGGGFTAVALIHAGSLSGLRF